MIVYTYSCGKPATEWGYHGRWLIGQAWECNEQNIMSHILYNQLLYTVWRSEIYHGWFGFHGDSRFIDHHNPELIITKLVFWDSSIGLRVIRQDKNQALCHPILMLDQCWQIAIALANDSVCLVYLHRRVNSILLTWIKDALAKFVFCELVWRTCNCYYSPSKVPYMISFNQNLWSQIAWKEIQSNYNWWIFQQGHVSFPEGTSHEYPIIISSLSRFKP